MTPISLGIFASANQGTTATSYESISTVTVGSGGASTVDFTSIPSTYTHLQIRAIAKFNYVLSQDQSNFIMRFNSDSSASYSRHRLSGNGTSASAASGSSETEGYLQTFMPSNASGSDNYVYGAVVIDILDYANTNKFKTIRGLGGFDRNGSGTISLASVLWQKTNAITSISIYSDSPQSWVQYSHFALYGIKAAA